MRLRGCLLSLMFLYLLFAACATAQPANIVNGGFEQNLTGWTKTGSFQVNYLVKPGQGVAAIGMTASKVPQTGAAGTLSQLVRLAVTPSYRLTFMLSIATAETGSAAADTLAVEIFSDTGKLLATPLTLSNLNKSNGFVRHTVPLDAYAGRTVRIQFRGQSNTVKATAFLLDDVALEKVLGPTGIRGKVKNALTNAGVKAEVTFAGLPAVVLNDTYTFANVPCATGRLRASAAGLQTFDEPFTPSCGIVNQKDIALKPHPTSLTGVVRDVPTGALLADITVNRAGELRKSDTSGLFGYESVPCVKTTLTVNARGYRPWRQDVTPTCGSNTNVNVALEPELTAIFLTVLDAQVERGIPHATVTLGTTSIAPANEAGLFLLAPMACASGRLTISAPGYQTYTRDYSPVCDTTNVETVRLVPNLTTVRGRVAHHVSGQTLPATVTLDNRSVLTTAGEYSITANCARTVVEVKAAGYRPIKMYYTPECGAQNTLDFALVPLPSGTSVCGTVTSAFPGNDDTIGVEGAVVTLGGRSDPTDKYGTYCLASIPCPGASKVSMKASKPGYRDSLKKSETVACNALTTIDFSMLEQHIEGTVTVGSSGTPPPPLAFATLKLGNDTVTSGPKGEFRFRRICRSDDLSVTAEGYASTTMRINPDCTSLKPMANVSLQPNATNVLVRLFDGSKGADRNLVVMWGGRTGTPFGDGFYSFSNVLCQTAPLTVFSARYQPLRTALTATCNTSAVYAYGLTPVRTMLRGTVADGVHGGPLADATALWKDTVALTGSDGLFRIENALCGTGTLTLSKDGYRAMDVPLTVSCAADTFWAGAKTLGR
jgi:hypothetical protein